MSPVNWRATLDPAAVGRIVADHYDLSGTLTPLPGERDLNYRLDTPGSDGVPGIAWVAKISAPDESDAWIEFETRLLERLAAIGGTASSPGSPGPPTQALVPGVRPDRTGSGVARPDGADGRPLRVRLLRLVEGRTLAETRPRSAGLLEDLGATLARLHEALAGHPERPPARDGFEWALDRALPVIDRVLDSDDAAVAPTGARAGLLRSVRAAAEATLAGAAGLPDQLIHGDVNDHNVLVSGGGSHGDPRVSAILDFGDAHCAPRVFDLAVAVAYAMLGEVDPIRAAEHITCGYQAAAPLSDGEIDQVVPLARARLGVSVSMASWRRRGAVDPDPYLLVSEEPAWTTLQRLSEIPDAIASGRVRAACGRPPCPRRDDIVSWIGRQEVHPTIRLPAERATAADGAPSAITRLDLSVASPLLSGRDTDDTSAFTRRVFDRMAEVGAAVGVGLWGEPRAFYLSEAFAGRPSELPERRTVHLGVDLFVPDGADVRAPLPGRVASVADHTDRLDYGPTVLLEHDTPHGPFWTLYGHLERASVADLRVGETVAAGTAFARVGPPPENGDWPPHLHIQIVLDRMGWHDTFPGVAAPRERDVWMAFCPDPGMLTGVGLDTAWRAPDEADLAARRARSLGRNLSLSYDAPIHVVRGRGTHLFDAYGRAYLDCVNNVAHVGHEHPRVVAALRRQAGVLNTNTRYLHESVIRYAERLAALFPDPLSVCFFVNSGSEANELALRMARTYTGRRGVVGIEGGYHGHTGALVDASHYKFAGPGGAGAPPWVRVAALPDPYRGRLAARGAGAGATEGPDRTASAYAADVERALHDVAEAGYPPAAFLHESVLSCGGQIVLPDGYLERAYRAARDAGAVCIADEVQVGFGRVGSHAWAFETQGVVPDIVTLGKPMGNGHPLGAVVTTPAIADAFANGMEFFSTFGGNPVSAEVGLAVLDVLRDEDLQTHAGDLGTVLLEGLGQLAGRHPAIGDVRGSGLFLGIEFVSDRDARTPWPEAADYVVQRMRARGVLLSTDGPDRNVIKIKPPMPFDRGDADRLLDSLDDILGREPP